MNQSKQTITLPSSWLTRGVLFGVVGIANHSICCVLAQSLYNNPTSYFGGGSLEKNSNSAYLDWTNKILLGNSKYKSSLFLSSPSDIKQGVAVHWSLNDTHINLAIAAQASGWLGFGLSENGGMFGSDLLLFQTSKPDAVLDAYIDDNRQPLIDDCQDWNLVSSHVLDDNNNNNTSWIMMEVSRLLNTKDTQDHPIVDDTNKLVPKSLIIAAWGDDDMVSYHGQNRARGAVRWFSESGGVDEDQIYRQNMGNNSDGFFELKALNYTIPTVDTTYAYFCLPGWNDFVALGVPNETLTIVGIEPILDQSKFVHHFTLRASPVSQEGCPCPPGAFDPTTGTTISGITVNDFIYAWAPGSPPMHMPDDVGAPLGGSSGYKAFRLEIHYNNQDLVSGIQDSSGVRFHYSTKPRPKEFGVFQLGDPLTILNGQPVGQGLAQHSFTCSGTCSSFFLNAPVSVLTVALHMHRTGASMRNDMIRQGQIIHTEKVDYFDFDYQGAQLIQQEPYQIRPGDGFQTTCTYKTRKDLNVSFGMSSQQEMCIVFIVYYPKIVLSGFPWICGYGIPQMCGSEWEKSIVQQIPRTFGRSSRVSQCARDANVSVGAPVPVVPATSPAKSPVAFNSSPVQSNSTTTVTNSNRTVGSATSQGNVYGINWLMTMLAWTVLLSFTGSFFLL